MNQRQCRFAFGEVVAEVLPAFGRIGTIVEDIVHELVSSPKVFSIRSKRLHNRIRAPSQYGSHFGTRLKQLGGFPMDDLEITLLGCVGIVRVHQLQHFSLSNHISRLGHDLHHALRREGGHHLKCARVNKVTDKHARLIAKHLIGGVTATTHGGPVNYIVVQQSGGMNKFNERSCLEDSMSLVSTGSADQYDQQWAQPLAAACDDVVRDLVNQGHRAFEACSDYAVDGLEVRLDERPYFFEGHRYRKDCVAGGIHNEPHILADADPGENGAGRGERAKYSCKLEKRPFDPPGIRQ